MATCKTDDLFAAFFQRSCIVASTFGVAGGDNWTKILRNFNLLGRNILANSTIQLGIESY